MLLNEDKPKIELNFNESLLDIERHLSRQGYKNIVEQDVLIDLALLAKKVDRKYRREPEMRTLYMAKMASYASEFLLRSNAEQELMEIASQCNLSILNRMKLESKQED